MIEIVPLTRLSIDWDTYLRLTKQATNRNVARGLDDKGIQVQTIPGYIVTLAELKEHNQNPESILNNPGNILDHVFYSFILISDRETPCIILENSKLSIIKAECINGLLISIVSGSLSIWREAIINGCSELVSYNLRLFLDKCLFFFEKEGLSKLWSRYSKIKMPDQTIKLIEKK